jgi:hypothetical protein
MQLQTTPDEMGQIVKPINQTEGERPDDVYIIVDLPDDRNAVVVSLKALQRNIKNPDAAKRRTLSRTELLVVANDLEEYIASWNE